MPALTPDALARVLRAGGATRQNADRHAPGLAAALRASGLDTRNRGGHVLAQGRVESGWLRYTEEIASGAAYEGRADLGNTRAGDGRRFKGRGLIQLTGRANYAAYAEALRERREPEWDVVTHPERVAGEFAADSAGYFWAREGLSREADRGDHVTNVQRISRAVNRGNPNSTKPANGEAERVDAFRKVMTALRKEGL